MTGFVAALGGNGTGKTTALRLLAAGDADLLGLSPRALPRDPGYLPQGDRKLLLSTDVTSLLVAPQVAREVALVTARQRTDDLLALFGMTHLAGRDFRTLSGGEQQLVSFLAAFTGMPDTVILDDPFAMLDTARVTAACSMIGDYLRDGHRSVICSSVDPPRLQTERTLHVGPEPDLALTSRVAHVLRHAPRGQSIPVSVDGARLLVGRRLLLVVEHLVFEPGRLNLVTGENGSGKSVLLKSICRYHRLHRGTVVIGESGQPRNGRSVLYLPQRSAALLGFGSVGQELRANTLSAPWHSLLETLSEARLLELPGSASVGSYGELKFRSVLAAVAGALVESGRRVLLLDEPDVALDEPRRSALVQVLAWLARAGVNVIIVTHRPGLYSSQTSVPVVEHRLVERALVRIP